MNITKVKNWLKENERSQAWLAKKINLSGRHLNSVILGKVPLTENVKEKLSTIIKD